MFPSTRALPAALIAGMSLAAAGAPLGVGLTSCEPEEPPTSTPTGAEATPTGAPTPSEGASPTAATPTEGASTPAATPTALAETQTPTDAATPTGAAPTVTEGAPTDAPTPSAAPSSSPTPSANPATPTLAPVGGAAPILFATQVPWDGFATISMPFANHLGSMDAVPRGGDLWIRYPDGSLRNLTQEAGFGEEGQQGAGAIAVREPCVHFDGQRAVFSMLIGAPTRRYELITARWQLYEVTGLEEGGTAVITPVPGQPAYNNVSPIYGSDDRILFASDRPHGGRAHLYPQLDEYESTATITGLYSLDPASGDLRALNHAPSGAFNPTLDSWGRVIFTRWDHLQRDQQADSTYAQATYGPVNFADESPGAALLPYQAEVFPEQRSGAIGNQNPMTFNQFFPWEIHQDGSGEETLNHVGRQELGGSYTDPSFNDDPNLSYYTPESLHLNRTYLRGDGGLFYLREDPLTPGTFFGVVMAEFADGRAGQIVTLDGADGLNPDEMILHEITHPSTRSSAEEGQADPLHSGHYRNPLPLADGALIASHTFVTGDNLNDGSTASPAFRYDFRLRRLEALGGWYEPAEQLIPEPGIVKSLSWWSPDAAVSYSGPLWEVDPVEVRPRPRPPMPTEPLGAPEAAVLADEGVDVAALRAWLTERELALIVSRDVTQRDRADVQQPYNLRIPGGVESAPADGRIYDVSHLQLFQGDLLRAYDGGGRAGRRVYPTPMHSDDGANLPAAGDPAGSVTLGADGSMAAFVPAGRALSWQLLSPDGDPVVRERNWVSFAPGEIRTCAACHGINTASQTGDDTPQNEPQALRALIRHWQASLAP